MLNAAGHYIARGVASLNAADPFIGLVLVNPLWCLIVAHVVTLGEEVRSQRSVSITKAHRPESISFFVPFSMTLLMCTF